MKSDEHKEIWEAFAQKELRKKPLESIQYSLPDGQQIDPVYFAGEQKKNHQPAVRSAVLSELFSEKANNSDLLDALNHGVSAPILVCNQDSELHSLLRDVRLEWIDMSLDCADQNVMAQMREKHSSIRDKVTWRLPANGGQENEAAQTLFISSAENMLEQCKKLVHQVKAYRKDKTTSEISIRIEASDDHLFSMAGLATLRKILVGTDPENENLTMEYLIRPSSADRGKNCIQVSQMMLAGLCVGVDRLVLDLDQVPADQKRSIRYIYHVLTTECHLPQETSPLQGSYFFDALCSRIEESIQGDPS